MIKIPIDYSQNKLESNMYKIKFIIFSINIHFYSWIFFLCEWYLNSLKTEAWVSYQTLPIFLLLIPNLSLSLWHISLELFLFLCLFCFYHVLCRIPQEHPNWFSCLLSDISLVHSLHGYKMIVFRYKLAMCHFCLNTISSFPLPSY